MTTPTLAQVIEGLRYEVDDTHKPVCVYFRNESDAAFERLAQAQRAGWLTGAHAQFQRDRTHLLALAEALEDILNEIPSCSCTSTWTDRGRVDPDCTHHRIGGNEIDHANEALHALRTAPAS